MCGVALTKNEVCEVIPNHDSFLEVIKQDRQIHRGRFEQEREEEEGWGRRGTKDEEIR